MADGQLNHHNTEFAATMMCVLTMQLMQRKEPQLNLYSPAALHCTPTQYQGA